MADTVYYGDLGERNKVLNAEGRPVDPIPSYTAATLPSAAEFGKGLAITNAAILHGNGIEWTNPVIDSMSLHRRRSIVIFGDSRVVRQHQSWSSATTPSVAMTASGGVLTLTFSSSVDIAGNTKLKITGALDKRIDLLAARCTRVSGTVFTLPCDPGVSGSIAADPDAGSLLRVLDLSTPVSSGWFFWAKFLSNNSFKLLNNAGIGGTYVANALTRLESEVINYSPDEVWIEYSINDINTFATANPTAESNADNAFIDSQIDYHRVLWDRAKLSGITPRAITTTGVGSAYSGAARINGLVAMFNEGLKNAAHTNGISIIDAARATINGTSTAGHFSTANFIDNIHYSKTGGYLVGREIANTLNDALVTAPNLLASAADYVGTTVGSKQLLPNPFFITSGGTVSGAWATFAANLPAGYTFTSAGTPTISSVSLAARSDNAGNDISFVIAASGASDTANIYCDLPSAAYALMTPDSEYVLTYELTIGDGTNQITGSNIRNIRSHADIRNGTTFVTNSAETFTEQVNTNESWPLIENKTFIFESEPFRVPLGITVGRAIIYLLELSFTAAGTGVRIKIGRAALRKVS